MQKAGFISVIGRTNAGKSSLVNSLLGEKISLVSHKQNATRRKINAIVMHGDNQLIFIDTPGLHQSEKLFNQMLIQSALKSIEGVDLVLFVASVKDEVSEYEKFLSLHCKAPHLLILNKSDLVSNENLLRKMSEYAKFSENFKALLPYSCKQKSAKNALLNELCKYLPSHPYFFDPELLTNTSQKELYKDFILEALFESFSDELPYHCEVEIKQFSQKPNLLIIKADIITSSNSHKGILIGKNGTSLQRLGIKARKKIEQFAQQKLLLELFVRVDSKWNKDKIRLEKVLGLEA